MLIIDAHEDLAWSMISFGRDYTLSAREIRQREQGTPTPIHNDDAMLGWSDYQRGDVGLVFATLFATPIRWVTGGWDRLCYSDPLEAGLVYRQQLDVYQRLADERSDQFRLISSLAELDDLLQRWEKPPEFAAVEQDIDRQAFGPIDAESGAIKAGNPVGVVMLMEGAEAVGDPGELEEWWQRGVRIIGPAWAGNRFCGGTREPGPLTREGFALLDRMRELGFGFDLSHMDQQAVLQAHDSYEGCLMATHSNAQALLKGVDSNRHLSDRVIRGIFERDGVIGVNFYNAFLKAGWVRGDRREEVTIDRVIDQIDYLCQLAGDALHAGIGTDFDGGFGLQSVPVGIDSVSDLGKLKEPLLRRGYSEEQCAAILGGNWLSILRKVIPETK